MVCIYQSNGEWRAIDFRKVVSFIEAEGFLRAKLVAEAECRSMTAY